MKFSSLLYLLIVFSTTISMGQNDNMKKRWGKVDHDLNNALPKTALAEVKIIYTEAKKNKDIDNQIKALIYTMRCNNQSDEDGFEKDIVFIKNEISSSSFPVNAILQSMLGKMYWQYYQQSRFRHSSISNSSAIDSTNIKTWDSKTILHASIEAYQKSLLQKEALLKYSTNELKQVIEKTDNHHYTSNLYDFLGREALNFFTTNEASVTRPSEQFNLNNEVFFHSSADFTKLTILSEDKLSLHLYAMQIFQQLELLHQKDLDPTILTDLVLSRLKFTDQHAALPNKKQLQLTTLQSLEKLTAKYPISTEVYLAMANIWRQRAEEVSGPLNNPKFPDANIRSLALCDSAIQRFPNTKGATLCQNLKTTLLAPSLTMKMEEVNLPEKPFRALISYNNIKRLNLRIIKLSPEEADKLRNELYYSYNSDGVELLKPYLSKKADKQQVVEPIQDPHLRMHSTEIIFEALPKGLYLIIASDHEQITNDKSILAYGFTTISNLSYVARSTDGKAQLYVLTRDKGHPVANAKVIAYTNEYDYESRKNKNKIVGTYTSDEKGYVEISNNGKDHSGYIKFDISTKNDRLVSNDKNYSGIYIYGSNKKHNQATAKQARLELFTDRAIYRPGQTVYFKGIYFYEESKNNFVVAPNKPVKISFYDANYQEKAHLNLVTNEFGSIQGSFTTPMGSMNGHMNIGNELAKVGFNVEEYKRPKFEVIIHPLKEEYKLNQQIAVKASAKAYAGNSIDGAKVSYKVVRRVQIPYWYRSYWNNFKNQETVITTGNTTTDENGNFIVNFNAVPDASVSIDANPVFNYSIHVDVTDINGETRSSETTLNIGYTALSLNIKVPAQLEGKKDTLKISATNQSGELVATGIQVLVYKLQTPTILLRKRLWDTPDKPLLSENEFRKLFPEDEYLNETAEENYPKQLVLEKTIQTQLVKPSEFVLPTEWAAGMYMVEAMINSDDTIKTKTQTRFIKVDPKSDRLPIAQSNWSKVSSKTLEPGQKLGFQIGSSYNDVHVLCEIEKDGKIIKKEFIKLNNNSKKIEHLITEEDRGGLSIHYLFVANNRVYSNTEHVEVPFTNKKLNIHWETFRNKLQPGQEEEWKVVISKAFGKKIASELMATLYDASLDAFASHNWHLNLYNTNYNSHSWSKRHQSFSIEQFKIWDNYTRPSYDLYKSYDEINWFGYEFGNQYGYRAFRNASMKKNEKLEMASALHEEEKMDASDPDTSDQIAKDNTALTEQNQPPTIRKDFRETAFFFPDLKTDASGNIILKFTMPEAITKWKLLGLAHTQNMSLGFTEKEAITQKELMVVPNAPRFLREGDELFFSAKVTNLSDDALNGVVSLQLFDAATMTPIDKLLGNTQSEKNFSILHSNSSVVNWTIKIPADFQAITYRVIAKAGKHSDGEENIIPVLSNRMLVTESIPLVIAEGEKKNYELKKLSENKSKTLVHHRLTLELTPNPVWYAVQALPYLAEYPYECAEQTFSRYYANALAGFIANSNPELKRMFDQWQNLKPDALISTLEKNEELKLLLLEQTPWLREAQNETEQKRRIALLFDLNKMNNEMNRSLDKLYQMQLSNGAWPWFTGMQPDRYITQHILAGIGHLKNLGVKNINEQQVSLMTSKAINYTDQELLKDYQEIKIRAKRNEIKLNEVRPSSSVVYYLYGRSFYSIKAQGETAEAIQFYQNQVQKYWAQYELYEQALIGITAQKNNDLALVTLMHKSFKERAILSEDKGMYWKSSENYYWYQAPIERQALLIEFFEAMKDRSSVDKMRFWLLTQKQTTHWKTTKATTEACYALLLNGTSWLTNDKSLSVSVDGSKIEFPTTEINPTLSKVWDGNEITPNLSKITLSKQGPGVAWGALHWQYYEDLDKITTHKNSSIEVTKQLMLEEQTSNGSVLKPVSSNTVLKPGDLVKVKLIINTDRNLEYVHIQDLRAAGFEPLNVLSGAKWTSQFSYYESTRDASTDFFIGFLKRGTYVLEYSLRVNNPGNFSNGITNIQCMYAPEFNSHSEGIRVVIDNQ